MPGHSLPSRSTVCTGKKLWEKPIRPSKRASGLPLLWEHVILKCLQPQPGERYSSAVELLRDLESFETNQPPSSARKLKRTRARGARAGLAEILLVWSAAIAILGGLSTFPAFENKTAAAGLAVLPVVNQTNSPEVDYVAKGIHSELVRRMRGVRELHVYELPAVGLNARFPEAERLQFSLKSNFAEEGARLRLALELTSNPDKRAVWSDQFEGSTADSLDSRHVRPTLW